MNGEKREKKTRDNSGKHKDKHAVDRKKSFDTHVYIPCSKSSINARLYRLTVKGYLW